MLLQSSTVLQSKLFKISYNPSPTHLLNKIEDRQFFLSRAVAERDVRGVGRDFLY